MGAIKRIRHGQSIVQLDDCDVRIFIKYKDKVANEIRFWKLPKNSGFWHMFRISNLFWAIYKDDARYLHGWFIKDGNILEILTQKTSECRNSKELENLLMGFEEIIRQAS